MDFLRWLLSDGSDASGYFPEREEAHAVAMAARERLSQMGRLQVELDAQREIQARVAAARVGRAARRRDDAA